MPVPNTASWSGELDDCWLGPEPLYGKQLALFMPERQGQGTPYFKRPHPVRQRKAMVQCLCDICGLPLRNKRKILAGNIRFLHDQPGVAGTQEPLVHTECYAIAAKHCPYVKRIEAGEVHGPWQVASWTLYGTITDPEGMAVTVASGKTLDGSHLKLLPKLPGAAICYIKLVPRGLKLWRPVVT